VRVSFRFIEVWGFVTIWWQLFEGWRPHIGF